MACATFCCIVSGVSGSYVASLDPSHSLTLSSRMAMGRPMLACRNRAISVAFCRALLTAVKLACRLYTKKMKEI